VTLIVAGFTDLLCTAGYVVAAFNQADMAVLVPLAVVVVLVSLATIALALRPWRRERRER
jgi:ABC-type sulfate transport system permease component